MTSAAEIIRSNSIGSSDIAPIAGISPFLTAYDVYLAKKGFRPSQQPNNERMFWGQRLQRVIAEVAAERLNVEIEWSDRQVIHPSRPWQSSSPDAYITTPPRRILEVKTAGLDQAREWDGDVNDDTGVPEHYWAQCEWQMSTTGLDTAYIAVLIGGNIFRIYVIRHDPLFEEMLLEEAENFWFRNLMADKPPSPCRSRYAGEYLRRRYPRERNGVRIASPDEIVMLEDYGRLRREIKERETSRDELEIRIKEAIADSEGLAWPRGKATWKKAKDGSETDWEAIARQQMVGFTADEQAAIIEEHTDVVQGSRRFLYRPDKEAA